MQPQPPARRAQRPPRLSRMIASGLRAWLQAAPAASRCGWRARCARVGATTQAQRRCPAAARRARSAAPDKQPATPRCQSPRRPTAPPTQRALRRIQAVNRGWSRDASAPGVFLAASCTHRSASHSASSDASASSPSSSEPLLAAAPTPPWSSSSLPAAHSDVPAPLAGPPQLAHPAGVNAAVVAERCPAADQPHGGRPTNAVWRRVESEVAPPADDGSALLGSVASC